MGRGRSPGSDWSEKDIATAALLWGEGRSGAYIADVVNRTRNAVLGMMARHRDLFPCKRTEPRRAGGRKKNGATKITSWSASEIERAAALWIAGETSDRIGEAIGRSGAAVRLFALRLPGKFPPRANPGRGAARGRAAEVLTLAERFPPPPDAPDMRPVTLTARRADQCAFGLWDDYGPKPTAESLYCGGAVDGDRPYCAFHARIIYQSPAVAAEKRRAA